MNRSAAVISTLILSLSLAAACSPLAASIAKQGGNNHVPSVGGGLSVKPHIVTFSTRVVEQGTRELDNGPGVTIGLTPQQLEDFKSSGSVTITLNEGVLPESISAKFEVSLTQDEINELGLAQITVATLRATDERTYVMTLSTQLTPEQAKVFQGDQLIAVELKISRRQ